MFEEKDDSKLFFIKETLEKCMKLAYFDRIKKTVTEEYFSVLPEMPAPYFKYDQRIPCLNKLCFKASF